MKGFIKLFTFPIKLTSLISILLLTPFYADAGVITLQHHQPYTSPNPYFSATFDNVPLATSSATFYIRARSDYDQDGERILWDIDSIYGGGYDYGNRR